MKSKKKINFGRSLTGGKDKMTILLIDDEKMNHELVESILKSESIKIISALNGFQALKILRHQKVDIIITDIQMPGIDGIETTRRIRQITGSEIPVFGLTAGNKNQLMHKVSEAGMNGLLDKPFNIADFYELLHHTVKKKQNTESIHSAQKIIKNSENSNHTNKPELKKHYNLEKLENLLLGNQTEILKMIGLFIDVAPKLADQLQQAFSEKNYYLTKQTAHKLKPPIDFMDIACLKEPVKFVETHAGEAENDNQTKEFIDTIAAIIHQSANQLKSLIPQ